MKELLVEFFSYIAERQERKFKAVITTPGAERVVAFASQQAADNAIKAGTHRKYNPQTDAGLEGGESSDQKPQDTTQQPAQATEKPSPVSQEKDREDRVAAAKERMLETPPKVIASLNHEELKKIEDEYVTVESAESDEMSMEYSPQSQASIDMPEEYSDESYYSPTNGGRKHSTKIRREPFQFDNKTRDVLKTSGFPEKYIKFLERCINTEVGPKGLKPPVTELIDVGGAGQISSQFGEVMSMAMIAVHNPEQRAAFADLIKQQIAATNLDLLEQKMGSKEFNKIKNDPKALKKSLKKVSAIADESWVDAALTHASSFKASMDEKYGQDGWTVQGTSWDIRRDVESLGLPYKNKGFSTDIVIRVNDKAQRVSLKKDENIMFFNGSTGEVNNFILNYLDKKMRGRLSLFERLLTESNSKDKEVATKSTEMIKRITGVSSATKAKESLRKVSNDIREEALNSAPEEVQGIVRRIQSFADEQLNTGLLVAGDLRNRYSSASSSRVATAIQNTFSGEDDAKYAATAWKITGKCTDESGNLDGACMEEQLQSEGLEYTTDRLSKICMFAGKVAVALADEDGDSKEAVTALNQITSIGKEIGNDLMKAIPKHPELLGGVMQKLAQAFPLKVCMDGTEFMLIDGVKVTQQTLQRTFGVSSYDKIQEGLDIVELPNGDSVLVFKAQGATEPIRIGVVQGRQKGMGYDGTVGLEIQCSKEFVVACAQANEANGDTSGTNDDKLQQLTGSGKRKTKTKG